MMIRRYTGHGQAGRFRNQKWHNRSEEKTHDWSYHSKKSVRLEIMYKKKSKQNESKTKRKDDDIATFMIMIAMLKGQDTHIYIYIYDIIKM